MLKYPYWHNKIDKLDIFSEVNGFDISINTYIIYKFIRLNKSNIENRFKMINKLNSIYNFYKIHKMD